MVVVHIPTHTHERYIAMMVVVWHREKEHNTNSNERPKATGGEESLAEKEHTSENTEEITKKYNTRV